MILTSPFSSQAEENQRNKSIVLQNILAILFYSLAMTIGLSFNDVITSIFDSFYGSQHVISKVTCLVVLIGVTILLATYSGSKVA